MPRFSTTASGRQAGGGETAGADEELIEASQQSLGPNDDDVAMVDIDGNEARGSQGEGARKRKRDASYSSKTTGTLTLEVNNSDLDHEAAIVSETLETRRGRVDRSIVCNIKAIVQKVDCVKQQRVNKR